MKTNLKALMFWGSMAAMASSVAFNNIHGIWAFGLLSIAIAIFA